MAGLEDRMLSEYADGLIRLAVTAHREFRPASSM